MERFALSLQRLLSLNAALSISYWGVTERSLVNWSTFKSRMWPHLGSVERILKAGLVSDSFSLFTGFAFSCGRRPIKTCVSDTYVFCGSGSRSQWILGILANPHPIQKIASVFLFFHFKIVFTQHRIMSQRAEGGASVLMAFLEAWERETLWPAWRRADLQREREMYNRQDKAALREKCCNVM